MQKKSRTKIPEQNLGVTAHFPQPVGVFCFIDVCFSPSIALIFPYYSLRCGEKCQKLKKSRRSQSQSPRGNVQVPSAQHFTEGFAFVLSFLLSQCLGPMDSKKVFCASDRSHRNELPGMQCWGQTPLQKGPPGKPTNLNKHMNFDVGDSLVSQNAVCEPRSAQEFVGQVVFLTVREGSWALL